MIRTYLTQTDPIEDGFWSISAFLLPKKVNQIAQFRHFSSRLFLVIYTLDHHKAQ